MRVLDLFAGKKGFSSMFVPRGHEVITVDNDPAMDPAVCADIRQLQYPGLELRGPFDVVLASPPCQTFSVAAIGHYWSAGVPAPDVAYAVGLVARTLLLIAQIRPRFWVMENPRGMLRTLIGPPRETVFYCSYGTRWKKPTDLWGTWPGKLRRPCAPHESSPRGSSSGGIHDRTLDAASRAEVPADLSLELCRRFEDALARGPVDRDQVIDGFDARFESMKVRR